MTLHPKLLEIRGEIAAGINPDLHPDNQVIWEDSRNVTITAAGVKKMAGWKKTHANSRSDPVRGMEQVLSGKDKLLFWGSYNRLFRLLGDIETDVSRGGLYNGQINAAGTTDATSWSMVEWGNWLVASNGIDPIQLYRHNVDSRFRDLNDGAGYNADDPPAFAEVLAKLGPHVIAFNTDEGGNAYEWCDKDDLSVWIPTSANAAGGNILRDFDSPIVAAKRLGDRLAIYGNDRMAIMSYLGTPFYFGAKFALKQIGAISKHSIVEDGRKNYGFGRRGFFVTDGATYTYIDDGRIRDTVFSEINWEQASKVCAFHKEARGEIIWYYPTGTNLEPNKGVVFNKLRNEWHFLDHGRTSGLELRIFDTPFTADSSGVIYQEETTGDADGSAMTAYVQSKPIAFQSPEGASLEDFVKYIEAIKLSIINKVGSSIKLKLGYKMDLEEDWKWWEARIQSDPKKPLFPEISGRWFTFRLESDQLADTWELQGLTVHGTIIGGNAQ